MTPNQIIQNAVRRSLLVVAAFLLSTTCSLAKTRVASLTADDEAPTYYFVVSQRSGVKVAYKLSEHPSVKHRGDNIIVETSTAEIEFPFSEVARFTFADRLGEGQTANAPYYDINNDGNVTVVDVALLISRMRSSSTPYIINEATNAVLRLKK